MAASDGVNNNVTPNEVELIVNRWFIDYYVFLATDLFKNEKYLDFCEIRDILEIVLHRPFESTEVMRQKILVLQLLSRINDGEDLDLKFDPHSSVSPLESALQLLEKIFQEYHIAQQDFENVCTSLKEMIVGVFIKNGKFGEAKAALNKYFPKPMVGKKAIFMGLISKKSQTHEVIEQLDFRRFKAEIYAFCQRFCPFGVPFLQKAAQQLIDRRQMVEDDDETVGPDDQDQPGPSVPQINTEQFVTCEHVSIQRSRLEAAYKDLAAGSYERTFTQLIEEAESEDQLGTERDNFFCLCIQNSEQDLQRDSSSPLEGSPADQSPQMDTVPPTQAGSLTEIPKMLRKKHLYTVARLVIEPDSQGCSQCTPASQELEDEVITEEPEQALDICHKRPMQSPETDSDISILKKRSRQVTNTCNKTSSSSSVQLSTDSEEEVPPTKSVSVRLQRLNVQSNSSKSRDKGKRCVSITDSSLDSSPNLFPHRLPPQNSSRDKGNGCVPIAESSPDSSPNLFPHPLPPQKSSTPLKDPVEDPRPSSAKWKQLFKNAKESKDTWDHEDTLFTSNTASPSKSVSSNSSGQRKKWTASETEKLKEGVKKFGEGAWSKIKDYYSLDGRSNVNLKDRWRTMKNTKMV